MKKINIAILLVLIILVVSCAKKQQTRIHGSLSNFAEGMVYLEPGKAAGPKADSTRAKTGLFDFRVKTAVTDAAYLRFEKTVPGIIIPVMLDEGTAQVGGNMAYPDQITVTGTPANDLLQEYRTAIGRYDIMLKAIAMDRGEMDAGGPDSLACRALDAKRDSLRAMRSGLAAVFVAGNRSNPAAAYLVAEGLTPFSTRRQIDSMITLVDTTVPSAFVDRLRKSRDKARL